MIICIIEQHCVYNLIPNLQSKRVIKFFQENEPSSHNSPKLKFSGHSHWVTHSLLSHSFGFCNRKDFNIAKFSVINLTGNRVFFNLFLLGSKSIIFFVRGLIIFIRRFRSSIKLVLNKRWNVKVGRNLYTFSLYLVLVSFASPFSFWYFSVLSFSILLASAAFSLSYIIDVSWLRTLRGTLV